MLIHSQGSNNPDVEVFQVLDQVDRIKVHVLNLHMIIVCLHDIHSSKLPQKLRKVLLIYCTITF